MMERPEYITLNVFSVNIHLVKEIILKIPKDVKIILGGKSVKYFIEELFSLNVENELIVTIGEGEYIIPEIVNGNISKDENRALEFGYSSHGKVYVVDKKSKYYPEDLSKVELDRTLLGKRTIYNAYGMLEEAIITSRECMYDCAFCGGARSLNRDVTIREKDEESIIAEINQIVELNKKVESIRILDDLFLKNRKSILKAIDIFNNFNLKFRAMSHINSIRGNEDILKDLKEAGCIELEIGVESGNQEVRDSIRKIGKVEDVEKVILSILENGINAKIYIIYGFLKETYEQCLDTYNLVKRLFEKAKGLEGTLRVSAFQFRPYHGTPIYNKIMENEKKKQSGSNFKIKYEHNDRLDNLKGRQQFNFMAGNYSLCTSEEIEKFVIDTNNLNNLNNEKSNNSEE